MLRNLIAMLLLAIPCGVVMAEKTEGLPKEAKTTSDIVKVVESNKGYYKVVSTVEFNVDGKKMFLLWYNPYSGRAACHVHGYGYDAKKEQWVRQLDRVFEGTHRVSVEVGEDLKIRDVKGEVVYKGKGKD